MQLIAGLATRSAVEAAAERTQVRDPGVSPA